MAILKIQDVIFKIIKEYYFGNIYNIYILYEEFIKYLKYCIFFNL